MKKRIYVVGNLLVKEDNLPLRILDRLRKRLPDYEFLELDTVEELEDRNPVIIDTVLDIIDVTVIDKIERLAVSKTCTVHDYDFGMGIKLLSKIGDIDSFKIIGLPIGFDEDEAIERIAKILSS